MKRFKCISKCPELDITGHSHCVGTEEGIRRREERFCDYCPCGNKATWEEIKEGEI